MTRIDPDNAVVIAARRTPFVAQGRGLAAVGESGLAAAVLRALMIEVAAIAERAGAGDDLSIGEVVLGASCDPGGDVARVAALEAGLGVQVPGVTLDRQCGSGLEAIRWGGLLVRSEAYQLVLAGGVESPSSAGGMERRAPFAPEGFDDPDMGIAAAAVALRRGIGRDRQDAYALRAHTRARAAARSGVFDAELVPLAGVDQDDGPRRTVTAQTLARLRPAFASELGLDQALAAGITAGNACGVSDGAAAVAIVPERVRAALGVPGLAIRAGAVVGVDPALPALALAPAVRRALNRAGLSLEEVDLLEVTEAFAAQVLAAVDDLGWDAFGVDAERICPDGGALSLGHPWGASGAALVVRLFSRMVRRAGPSPDVSPVVGHTDPGTSAPHYGVAACAIGGGQGLALVVERVG